MEEAWTRWDMEMRRLLPPDVYAAFGLDRQEDDVHESLNGLNRLTFPHACRWRTEDEEDMVWVRAGLYVFDFKRLDRSVQLPELKEYTLIQAHRRYRIRLTVRTIRMTLQSSAHVGASLVPRQTRPIYSRNCGRAVCEFVSANVTRFG